MKLTVIVILTLATIGSILIYRADAEPRIAAAQAEACVGLSCWPEGFPIKHKPAHRPSLPPQW